MILQYNFLLIKNGLLATSWKKIEKIAQMQDLSNKLGTGQDPKTLQRNAWTVVR